MFTQIIDIGTPQVFVKRIRVLSYKIDFPKGASDKVIESAKIYINKYGKNRLNEVSKLHFKTVNSL